MLTSTITNSGYLSVLLLMMLLISGCGGGGDSKESLIQNDEEARAVTVRFEAPALLKTSPDDKLKGLTPSVSVNGLPLDSFRKGEDQFWSRVKTELPLNESVNFTVVWSGKFNNEPVILGRIETSISIQNKTTVITIDQSSFETSSYDDDGDSKNNFNEWVGGSNPFEMDENLEGTSLKVTFTIPDVDYAGELDFGVVWQGSQVKSLINKGNAYEGTLYGLIPGEGDFRISIHSKETGERTHIYQYDKSNYSVQEGENLIRVSEDQFVAKPLKLHVLAKIPDRQYPGDYTVTLRDMSEKINYKMTLKNGAYTTTLEDALLGPKKMAVEIRNSLDIIWASADKYHTVKAGANKTSFSQGDFSFSFDTDGDGISNIDDTAPTVTNIDINIPFAADGPPVIDGIFDKGPWSVATAIDAKGQSLNINHLMMERRGSNHLADTDDTYELDLQPGHVWRAMYDENYLYILVEVLRDHYLTCDSTNPWDDDNLNLYWDGDNSKGTSYDGINDFHLMIPLLQISDDCSVFNNNGRMSNGSKSAPMTLSDGLQYATGMSIDPANYIYEVRIDLKEAGIVTNTLFGIDIHIDDDDNGGSRDQKWGWKHPSRRDNDVDETYKNPSVMANATLN